MDTTHGPNIPETDPAEKSTRDDRPPKPIPLAILPQNIPTELTALSQWVCWRYWWDDESGKWTKKPYRPKDGNATSHNVKEAKYWTSFDFAYQRYLDSQSESWRFDGIGVVLLPDNLIVGFDLDHCRDPETGEVKPWALEVVHQVPTYWEVSPSGTGLRGFAAGHKPGSRCRNDDIGFEMYTSSRYLCIRTYRTEAAITRHFLYQLVKKRVTPALSGVPDGRNHEGNMPITARIDLFLHFKGTMTSYLSFPPVGPYQPDGPPRPHNTRTEALNE